MCFFKYRLPLVVALLLVFSSLAKGMCVFVSSTDGNDNNSGLTVDDPFKTILAALGSKGDTICLKAGNVFYENIQISNKLLTRYGDGHNPLLCGFKMVINNKWVQIKDNIWQLDLFDVFALGHTENGVRNSNSKVNNIAFFHTIDDDAIHGRKVKTINELETIWDFCQDNDVSNDVQDPFRYIYLYCDKDPNTIKMDFATGTAGIISINSIIDGVNVQGFGFGISLRYSGIIRNCRIDAIGGRTLVTAKSFICDGNGIGIWIDQDKDTENVLIEHCYISRVFDAGICMQGTSGGKATAKNVVCRDNLLVNCCQAWEDVLNNYPDKPYENCIFENNYAIRSGITPWGYYDKRYKYCHVLGNNTGGRKQMVFKNNIFIDGNFYCSARYEGNYMSNIWYNNKCYLKNGDYILCHCDGYRDVLRLSNGKFKSLKREYSVLTGDRTTSFYNKNERYIKRLIEKTIKKFLEENSYCYNGIVQYTNR